MEFDGIYEELQSKLQIEDCKDAVQAILWERDEEKILVNVLSEIVNKPLVYEPIDIPFQYQAKHWYENPKAREINNALKDIASWNISDLNRARIHDFLWVAGKIYNSAIEAIRLYEKYIFSSENFEKILLQLTD